MTDEYSVVIQPADRYFRAAKHDADGLIALYSAANAWGAIGVEVGSARGESAEIACQFLKHLYCVDPWALEFDSSSELFFDARMAAFRNYTKIKKESHVACNDFADESLDIVYIDGMHDYENVKRDLLSWFPKVKLGGWIAGHDYDYLDGHKGVIQAVDEVFGVPELRFVDASFLFRKTPELTQRVTSLFPCGYVAPPPTPLDVGGGISVPSEGVVNHAVR